MGKRTFYLPLEAHRLLLFVSDWRSRWKCKMTLLKQSAYPLIQGVIGIGGLERDGERRGFESWCGGGGVARTFIIAKSGLMILTREILGV